jgi:serine/threonine-protein kinase
VEHAVASALGRYLLLEAASGAPGAVLHAAYDPALERRVWLRRLRRDDPATPALVARARAVGRVVGRPLVVVHDVGEVDDEGYFALDTLDEVPLPAYLDARRPRWEVMHVILRDVVSGLEGLRDAGVGYGFEPSDVRVNAAGRARLWAGLDREGLVETATSAGDAAALCTFVLACLRDPRVEGTPPRGVERAAEAARAEAEAGRSPLALLARELARDHLSARRRSLVACGIVGVAAAGAWFGIHLSGQATDSCAQADVEIASLWAPETRDRLREAFERSGAASGARSLGRVVEGLDRHRDAWSAIARDVCARKTSEDLSRSVARSRCLQRRREELESVLSLLVRGEKDVVFRSAQIVDALPDPASCDDPETVESGLAPPADAASRTHFDDLRRRVIDLRTLVKAGKLDEPAKAVDDVVAGARELGHPALLAEALGELAVIRIRQGRPHDGEVALREMIAAAMRGRHLAAATDGWTRLARLLGEDLARWGEAEEALRMADAAVRRLGDPPRPRADLMGVRAVLAWARGRYGESAALHREALELVKARLPDDMSLRASILNNLANSLNRAGELDAALEHYTAAQQTWEGIHGTDHPDVASVVNNIGTVELQRGRLEAAEAAFRRALAVRRAVFGNEHPLVAASLGNIGIVASDRGDLIAGREAYEEALRVVRATDGPESVAAADGLINLGNLEIAQKRPSEARQDFEQALAIYRARLGDEHPYTAQARHNVGWALRHEGHLEKALPWLEQAAAARERLLGADHAEVASSLEELGAVLLELGRTAAAASRLERALAIRERLGASRLGWLRFTLARALGGGARALQLARKAREDARKEPSAPWLPEVEVWLRRMGASTP